MTRSLPKLVAIGTAFVAIGAVLACRGATQIVVHVRTNADCSKPANWKGVAVSVGAPGPDVESRDPTLTTSECHPGGDIGSLVVTPSGAKDGEIAVRVVAGITRRPEECRSALYAGCIVARRALRFEPHDALDVVVDLTTDCTGFACDSTHTCVSGACVDQRANLAVAATVDGGVTGPTVRCGPDGVRCGTSGQVCCLTVSADKSEGQCRDVKDCPPASLVLYCDDDSDCVGSPGDTDGGPAVCCISGASGYCNFGGSRAGGSQCVPASKCFGNTVLCEDRKPCLGGNVCQPSETVPSYHSCCFYE